MLLLHGILDSKLRNVRSAKRALRIIYGGSRFNNSDSYASYCAELGIETLRVRRDQVQ